MARKSSGRLLSAAALLACGFGLRVASLVVPSQTNGYWVVSNRDSGRHCER